MAETRNPRKPSKKKQQIPKQSKKVEKKPEKQPSWAVVRSIFTCKHHVQIKEQQPTSIVAASSKRCKKVICSGSLCSNTKVMQRPESSSSPSVDHNKKWGSIGSCHSTGSASSRSMKTPLNEKNGIVPISSSSSALSTMSSRSSAHGSFRGMQFSRLSGCYECRMVVDPALGVTIRATLCSCPVCGEIFMKPEALELHQSVRHAVSELGPEDTSRNIVEIIFQSSWLKKQAPICKIERILKVQNSQRTITRFEEYRDSIKGKASKHAKKHPRCVADGNELLRFHCTSFICSIGMNGSSNLCNLVPQCNVCSIIRNGFKLENEAGICTTATSGKAHDSAEKRISDGEKRAMLVCRVIAGRVKRKEDLVVGVEDFDSAAGAAGVYSDLDELFVFNPKSILPCFVVIYKGY